MQQESKLNNLLLKKIKNTMQNPDDISEEEIIKLMQIYSKIKPHALKKNILELIENFSGLPEEDF